MKQRYDLALKCQQLEVGDAVWLHNPQRKKGLSPKLHMELTLCQNSVTNWNWKFDFQV